MTRACQHLVELSLISMHAFRVQASMGLTLTYAEIGLVFTKKPQLLVLGMVRGLVNLYMLSLRLVLRFLFAERNSLLCFPG